ncbi:MAG: hypothetical protein EXR55_04245 [Dehalococcoidia bacterium]|nr:hypothetical protein [Dehalococcoidia bacterium]
MSSARSVRLLLAWLPLFLWLGLIYYLSSRSSFPEPPLPPGGGVWLRPYLSPLAHVVEYVVLGALAYRAAHTGRTGRRLWVGVFIFGVVAGALDEFHQSYVRGRAAELADVLADGAGTLLALATIWVWRRR